MTERPRLKADCVCTRLPQEGVTAPLMWADELKMSLHLDGGLEVLLFSWSFTNLVNESHHKGRCCGAKVTAKSVSRLQHSHVLTNETKQQIGKKKNYIDLLQ